MSDSSSWTPADEAVLETGDVYRPEFMEAAVAEYGINAAWLLLSIDHYGWRGQFDLTTAALRGAESIRAHPDRQRHLWSALGLLTRSSLFSVSEQLAQLVLSGIAHQDGSNDFIGSYLAFGSLPARLDDLSQIDQERLLNLMGLPPTAAEVAADLRRLGYASEGLEADAEIGHRQVRDIARELTTNFQELTRLVARDPVQGAGDDHRTVSEGHSLRTVDNAFRHGFRVLWPDVVPQRRSMGAIRRTGVEEGLTENTVHLLQSITEPVFATMVFDEETTTTDLESIRVLSIRIRQVARALLMRAVRSPSGLITIANIDLQADVDHDGL